MYVNLAALEIITNSQIGFDESIRMGYICRFELMKAYVGV
jgi:hypothetical protein